METRIKPKRVPGDWMIVFSWALEYKGSDGEWHGLQEYCYPENATSEQARLRYESVEIFERRNHRA